MKIKSIRKVASEKPVDFYDVINANPFNNFLIKTNSSYIVSHNCLASFFDEISFIPTQDIEKQKARAIDMIDTAVGGMKTRFTHQGKNPGIVILASSKRSDKSFLEQHMKKKAVSEGDNTIIIDEAVWNIKPKGTYSDKIFHVAVGNRFLASEIVPDSITDLTSYRDKGYRIIDVPADLKPDFVEDIDRALCDFAGISSSELTTYISGIRFSQCKTNKYQNPFVKDIIEVGNSPDDTSQYWDFFDLSRVPQELKYKPLFIHLDMSISGDKTGIAGTWIKGKKVTQEGQPSSKDLMFQAAFSVSVKAPKGFQVSFEKNRQFIRWLRDNGFNVKMVSCFSGDTLIATPKGNKPIKDFKPGDLVLSYNQDLKKVEPAVVSELLLQGTENKFINIETEFGDIIECTYEHPILTQRGYIKAKDLTQNDKIIFDDHTVIKNRLLKTNYFIDNEYLDKYVDICVSGLEVTKEKYVHEKHHIVPRFYFKNNNLLVDNSKNNITTLTYRQHAIAHWYLSNCAIDRKVRHTCLTTLMFFFKTNVLNELTEDMLQKFERAQQEYAILTEVKNKGNKSRTGQITPLETRLKQSKSNMYIHRKENLSEKTIKLMRKNHSGGGVADWTKYTPEYRKEVLGKGSKGSHWYTNGENNIKLFDGQTIPNGYHAGRCGIIGNIFANNGHTQIRVKSNAIPEGFVKGKLKINKQKKKPGVEHHSLETRIKISESLKKYWQLKRQGSKNGM